MAETLIIVGASARAAAAAAKRAGYQPYGIDLFADDDLRALGTVQRVSRFPQELLPALHAAPASPWLYTGGLENYPSVVDRMAAERPLLGNPGSALREVRHPWHLQRTLRSAGFRYPDLRATTDIPTTGRWLLKPLRSGGGRGVRMLRHEEALAQEDGWYLQEFIEGQAGSALFVANSKDCVLVGTSQQLLGGEWNFGEPFAYVGSIAPMPGGELLHDRLAQLGRLLASAFQLRGLFGVDFIRSEAEFWTIEVNPRYPASAEVIERATGVNPIAAHVAACRDEIVSKPPRARDRYFGKEIVYASGNSAVGGDFLKWVARQNAGNQWPVVADIPAQGTEVAAGDPVVTVFADAEDPALALTTLRRLAHEATGFLAAPDQQTSE